jgi:hypothetical protein
MQHAHGGADATAAAAAATVAPLLQLRRAAKKTENLARYSRMLELYKRALAAAELAQPCDSLIIAVLLDELGRAYYHNIAQAVRDNTPAAARHAMAADSAESKQRCLQLLHARWQAGTLFAPTAEETAYLVEDEYPRLPAQMCGAFVFISVAKDIVLLKLLMLPCTPAELEARLHAVYGALHAALETDARDMLERNPRTGQAWPASSASSPNVFLLKSGVHRLITDALCNEVALLLRGACGLSPADETALRQLAKRYKAEYKRNQQQLPEVTEGLNARHQQIAAADVARHGLRRCALPSCDAQEPHPKLFKLCGRCRRAAYCCAAHSVEDWKRHKREDGCKAAP